MIGFKIIKKSKLSKARLGVLKTPHGEIETPAFVGVATQATIKILTTDEVLQTKTQILIANTYHLHQRPGEHVVAKSGGVHKFMNWPGALMTDSGGFQVFSLGFGSDHGVGKILKEKKDIVVKADMQPQKMRITEDGAHFRSPIDGREIFIGPKESIRIQEKLGADIIFAFDECTSPVADYEYTKRSLRKSHRWAKQCLEYQKTNQALFGITQGGKFEDLRIESAKLIGSLPFAGFGIGGEFGNDKKKMAAMIRWVVRELPENKPRHLLGIGHPEDIPKIIKAGVDLFDCVAPTQYARRGIAFISAGKKLDLAKAEFLNDKNPIDKKCGCFVCQNYRRNYISHLLRAKEITPLKLLTFHNLYFFNSFVENIRKKIRQGLTF